MHLVAIANCIQGIHSRHTHGKFLATRGEGQRLLLGLCTENLAHLRIILCISLNQTKLSLVELEGTEKNVHRFFVYWEGQKKGLV